MSMLLNMLKSIFIYRPPETPDTKDKFTGNQSGHAEKGQNQSVGAADDVDWQMILQKLQSSQTDKITYKNGDNNKAGPNEVFTIKKPAVTIKKRRKGRKGTPNESFTGLPDVSYAAIEPIKNGMVSNKLAANIEYLKLKFYVSKNQDIVLREFRIAQKIEACLVFVDGMVDTMVINQFVLPQLMNPDYFANYSQGNIFDYIIKNVISIYQVTRLKDYDTIIHQILNGITALFIEGFDEVLLIESRGFEKREIESPKTENVIKGSQEGFTENLRTSLSLIRKIVKNNKLVSEILPVGGKNKINCALLYLEDTVDPQLIEEVKRRISGIKYDFIGESGMQEQLLQDHPFMLFPQVISTERPDRAASFIMEGQVVIICEGSPFVIAVPVTIFHLFHTSEDSALRWQYGTFIRLIRLFGMLTALMLPGLWIALVQFHAEMIPTSLLMSIVKMREPVPFPIVIELLLMELSFELIREGGIRIPGVIGQTLGIIGALILGQAAVAAGLVSPILIIIVAITGIGNFVIPNYNLSMAVRIGRFLFIFLGAVLGFYGISIGITIMFVMLCSMKSFGVPFMTPFAPKTKKNSDMIIRKPIFKQPVGGGYLKRR